MAPPETNMEMAAMARDLANDCIDFSIPGGAAGDETVIAILLLNINAPKRPKFTGKAIIPSLRRTNWQWMRKIPRRAKPWLCTLRRRRRRVVHWFKYSCFACTG
jgi:hypothetical protein